MKIRGYTESSPFKKLQPWLRIQRCQLPTAPPRTSQNPAPLKHIPGNMLSSTAQELFNFFYCFSDNLEYCRLIWVSKRSTALLSNQAFYKKCTKSLPKLVYPWGSRDTCQHSVASDSKVESLQLQGWSTKGCTGQAWWRIKPRTAKSSQHRQRWGSGSQRTRLQRAGTRAGKTARNSQKSTA